VSLALAVAQLIGKGLDVVIYAPNVHLSNLPENLAFFSGAIDAAGSGAPPAATRRRCRRRGG